MCRMESRFLYLIEVIVRDLLSGCEMAKLAHRCTIYYHIPPRCTRPFEEDGTFGEKRERIHVGTIEIR